jgi:hypothetical protein
MVFTYFFGSPFPICLKIFRTSIMTIFFSSFSTSGSHGHFIRIRYTTREPIERNVVYFDSPSHFSSYSNNPPYLCFPFFGKWYTYNRSCIKCDSYIFTIVKGVINIRALSAASEMCNLVSIGVGPFYITSSWLSYSRLEFLYFGRISGIHIIC